ncbi:unnamed protein product [Ranitomeya imitator]|uniref:Ig-like domain-containing protein n=1 Tax=Ranitomeya imitator TaxID=111125 RepID=A0ABN9MLZ5_9NEOB|nr:unnamed protein product [Ranitomeya imitator]
MKPDFAKSRRILKMADPFRSTLVLSNNGVIKGYVPQSVEFYGMYYSALRYRYTKRCCSDTDNDVDRCSVAVWSLESCHTDSSPATNDAGNQGKHRVTKRRAALSNPMFILVTIVKIKKNKHYILIFRCLSPALCFPALTVSTAAGKQSGDITAVLSGWPALIASAEKHSGGQTAEGPEGEFPLLQTLGTIRIPSDTWCPIDLYWYRVSVSAISDTFRVSADTIRYRYFQNSDTEIRYFCGIGYRYRIHSVTLQISMVESGPGVVRPSETLDLTCKVTGASLTDSTNMHGVAFIRQPESKGLIWLGVIWYNAGTSNAPIVQGRITLTRDTNKGEVYCKLTGVKPEESGTYYCVRYTQCNRWTEDMYRNSE